ncbi:MAG: zinc-dependent alcohol dehydrogenase, partial [Acidimicrobiia bacterium]
PVARALDIGLVEPERGVFFANLETAVNVYLDTRLPPGFDGVVVTFGQGVVGLLITRVLSNEGIARVVTIDPLPIRRELSKQMGAERALDFSNHVPEAIMEMTGGRGAEVVIEVSGNPEALNTAIECAAFQGRIVVGSWYGTKPAELDLGGSFHRKRLRIVSSQVSSVDPELAPKWDADRRREYVRELMLDLDLEQLISHRIPFDDAAMAYELIDGRANETIQVVLTYERPGV